MYRTSVRGCLIIFIWLVYINYKHIFPVGLIKLLMNSLVLPHSYAVWATSLGSIFMPTTFATSAKTPKSCRMLDIFIT